MMLINIKSVNNFITKNITADITALVLLGLRFKIEN